MSADLDPDFAPLALADYTADPHGTLRRVVVGLYAYVARVRRVRFHFKPSSDLSDVLAKALELGHVQTADEFDSAFTTLNHDVYLPFAEIGVPYTSPTGWYVGYDQQIDGLVHETDHTFQADELTYPVMVAQYLFDPEARMRLELRPRAGQVAYFKWRWGAVPGVEYLAQQLRGYAISSEQRIAIARKTLEMYGETIGEGVTRINPATALIMPWLEAKAPWLRGLQLP